MLAAGTAVALVVAGACTVSARPLAGEGGRACAVREAGPLGLPCGGADSATTAEDTYIRNAEAPGGKPILRPYDDKIDDQPHNDKGRDDVGNCTIGLGHLIHKGGCTHADDVKWEGKTEAELVALYHTDVVTFEEDLNKILIGKLKLSKLKPCQYNGLFDLYFNGGATWFASKTDLYRALKSGQVRYALVPGSEVLLFRHYYILGLDSKAAEATYVCNGSTISVGVNGTIGSPWLLSGETPYKKLELSGSYKSGLYSDKWELNFELKPSIKP